MVMPEFVRKFAGLSGDVCRSSKEYLSFDSGRWLSCRPYAMSTDGSLQMDSSTVLLFGRANLVRKWLGPEFSRLREDRDTTIGVFVEELEVRRSAGGCSVKSHGVVQRNSQGVTNNPSPKLPGLAAAGKIDNGGTSSSFRRGPHCGVPQMAELQARLSGVAQESTVTGNGVRGIENRTGRSETTVVGDSRLATLKQRPTPLMPYGTFPGD